ncbi:very short patch repair endonuclease [Ideonella sp.]|uniref:very short patch repair endonuclease n=1 Tax=Ideonella sp. TaxID=1929293 RepID=UPI0035AE1A61
MTDVLSPEQRRLNMSRIRGRDTKPEVIVRKALHAIGLRYRLHMRSLPGTPDLVFPKHSAVVFVHGCFWHCHADCPSFKLPATRPDFWRSKLSGNVRRDMEASSALNEAGWRVLTIWECALTGPRKLPLDDLTREVRGFLAARVTGPVEMSIPGATTGRRSRKE